MYYSADRFFLGENIKKWLALDYSYWLKIGLSKIGCVCANCSSHLNSIFVDGLKSVTNIKTIKDHFLSFKNMLTTNTCLVVPPVWLSVICYSQSCSIPQCSYNGRFLVLQHFLGISISKLDISKAWKHL